MKISIITVCRNAEETIKHALDSFFMQDYPDKEIIVVDGASSDQTVRILKEINNAQFSYISEPDKGMYDAMNKGLELASGDIIGILNSDDFYPDSKILSTISDRLLVSGKDSIFADVNFVSYESLDKIVRRYSSKNFTPEKFAFGYMPAHPSFFTKAQIYEEYGHFKTDYKIAADFELLVRFLGTHKISYEYINEAIVHMRTGGVSNSSLKNRFILNQEIVRACRENGINTNLGKILLKIFNKHRELRVN